MVTHIVMWNVKDEAEGMTKHEIIEKMVRDLKGLKNDIAEIASIDAGADFNGSPAAYDVALYSTFPSKDALAAYQAHPAHVKVAGFIKSVVCDRAVVDYE